MITEEMLRIAAAEADQAIRDSLPHPADCDHQFSPRFERKMKRVIRRGRHPVAYKFLHRAACLLVVVTLVGASWLTVDAEARGAFFAWVRQQYENFVEYRFEGLAPDEEMTTNFAPTWLPEGYEEAKAQSPAALLPRLIATVMVKRSISCTLLVLTQQASLWSQIT